MEMVVSLYHVPRVSLRPVQPQLEPDGITCLYLTNSKYVATLLGNTLYSRNTTFLTAVCCIVRIMDNSE